MTSHSKRPPAMLRKRWRSTFETLTAKGDPIPEAKLR
jgi:hypothetical protein